MFIWRLLVRIFVYVFLGAVLLTLDFVVSGFCEFAMTMPDDVAFAIGVFGLLLLLFVNIAAVALGVTHLTHEDGGDQS
jgi:hypothetical protein